MVGPHLPLAKIETPPTPLKLDVHILNMVAKTQVDVQVVQNNTEHSRVVLGLLDEIGREGGQSQRAMADKFDVALGLVNAYLKTCIKKGYVKVQRLPPRRYVYALTPKGLAEKLRLTLLLLSRELDSFRRARIDYKSLCLQARHRGWRRVVLIGASELAEIAALCALETDIVIAALVDENATIDRLIGLPVVAKLTDVVTRFDGSFITDVRNPQPARAMAIAALGEDHVLAPDFFGFSVPGERAA